MTTRQYKIQKLTLFPQTNVEGMTWKPLKMELASPKRSNALININVYLYAAVVSMTDKHNQKQLEYSTNSNTKQFSTNISTPKIGNKLNDKVKSINLGYTPNNKKKQ